MPTTMMWFRRDLRLSDNPALLEAVHEAGDAGEVVACFVLDDRLRQPAGAPRLTFLYRCLRALDESIDGRLVVRAGPPAATLVRLAGEVGATVVCCAEDFGPYGRRRDEEVAEALAVEGVELRRVGSPYAVAPGTIRTGAGESYKVFTPFSRAWREHGWSEPGRAPSGVRFATGIDGDGVPDDPSCDAALPVAGEAAAKRASRRFWDARLEGYAAGRDDPGTDATSRLSVHLKYGTVHPRQLLAKLDRGTGPDTFRTELCWREFYADVLLARPDTVRQSFLPGMRAMVVDEGADADERFTAWAEGRTGYPIVDAGMRQLRAEAWVHNRVRMIVASFLVKDLHLDWTRGARHFMDHLVDGDVASNQHGWQWTAGTGTDAAPYFRIFNPTTQATRYDADGTYVRRWVPELAGVAGTQVHEPWKIDGGPPDGYPLPIVDHAEEREEALRRYDAVRDG
ncbi:MAG: deoxyribodipyrimidine photo-lyase [Acidimicrobiia bacterium]|nr:deoxyribodipyrimidine photo-lyase [Acidimicrobiia bacterium]